MSENIEQIKKERDQWKACCEESHQNFQRVNTELGKYISENKKLKERVEDLEEDLSYWQWK